MKKALLVLLVISSVFMLGMFSEKKAENVISVSGEGTVYFAPNVGYVIIGVDGVYKTANDGQLDANRKIAIFLKEINKYIPERNIKTNSIQINRKYEFINRKQKFVGYSVTQTLKIRMDDLKLMGQVIDAGLKAGLNQLQSIQFSNTNSEKFELEALQKALKIGEAKVETIGKVMKLRGLRLKAVGETNSRFEPYVSRGMEMKALHASAAPTSVMPGELSATAVVYMDYAYLAP